MAGCDHRAVPAGRELVRLDVAESACPPCRLPVQSQARVVERGRCPCCGARWTLALQVTYEGA